MTATATPNIPTSEQQIQAAIGSELWRSYRKHRAERSQERPSVAAGLALSETGFTKSDTRSRLTRLLEEKEQRSGLRPTPGERREDEALEAAARAAEAQVEHESGSLEAIEADALQRVDSLKAQIELMAVEALTDAKVAAEQKAALSELTEAERALENVARARRVTSRREVEAAEQAAQQAREQAEAEAAKLQQQIRKAAERVDSTAGVFAESVSAFRVLRERQAAALRGAGRGEEAVRQRSYRPGRVAEALSLALKARDVKIDGIAVSVRDEPLAAGEPEKL